MTEQSEWVQRLNQLTQGSLQDQVRGLVQATREGFELFASAVAEQERQIAELSESVRLMLLRTVTMAEVVTESWGQEPETQAEAAVALSTAAASVAPTVNPEAIQAAVRAEIAHAVDGLRSDIAFQVGALREELAGSIGAMRDEVSTVLKGLHGESTVAVGGVREEATSDVEKTTTQLSERLVRMEGRFEELESLIESSVLGLRGALSEALASSTELIGADVEKLVSGMAAKEEPSLDGIRADVQSLRHWADAYESDVEILHRGISELKLEMEGVRGQIQQTVAGIEVDVRSAAEGAIELLAADLERAMGELGDQITGLTIRVETVQRVLEGTRPSGDSSPAPADAGQQSLEPLQAAGLPATIYLDDLDEM